MFGTIQQETTSPDCQGSGKIVKEKCPDCHGDGYITTQKNIEITIPAGIDDGQTLRRSGGGDPVTNGGPRGDLLVDIAVSQHPFFKRQGTNIYSTEEISFARAALGGTKVIKTVDGSVELTIKPGTQSDTKVRLREKGVPVLNRPGERGDHFVNLVVTVPDNLNKKQKEALKAYAAACGEEL
jgi:molecular chaperone DnaJ